MTYDPLEWTVRDPLEDTTPDPVERGRGSLGRRRAVEVAALLLLAPGLLTAQWIDNRHQSRPYQTREQVTIVRRGGTGTLTHIRLRMLGRDTTGAPKSATTPAGAVSLKLVVQAQPLDAKAVKDLAMLGFTVRDRAGHVWSAAGMTDRDRKPAVGVPSQVTVTATVPAQVVSSVVLEIRPGGLDRHGPAPTPVLRFAH
jgi:hypothetical protein